MLLLASIAASFTSRSSSIQSTSALSPREQEVLRLYARGFSLKEIGEQLGLSVKTVDTYKTRIMEKLSLTKKSEVIAYAMKQGLVEMPP